MCFDLLSLALKNRAFDSSGFCAVSVQFSPLTDWVDVGTWGTIQQKPVFSAEGPCEQVWHRQGCPFFDDANPTFLLTTTMWSILQGSLKDGYGEAVVTCDKPEPCKFPSLDSCQERFLRTHKGVDIVSHPVGGLVLQVWDAEKFPKALGFKGLDPFLRVSKQGSCFSAIGEVRYPA